ncbi:hypothetical protein PV326_001425 [Microctonus aethiopoides]|nr:hypothetical protein PV326_001425 [Microctonus aethiopoides]
MTATRQTMFSFHSFLYLKLKIKLIKIHPFLDPRGRGRDVAWTWLERGLDVARTWRGRGRNVAGTWRGRGLAGTRTRTWPGRGWDVTGTWPGRGWDADGDVALDPFLGGFILEVAMVTDGVLKP